MYSKPLKSEKHTRNRYDPKGFVPEDEEEMRLVMEIKTDQR
jgi:hypothetical protein